VAGAFIVLLVASAAIVLGSVVGTWRQHGYGNLRRRDGLLLSFAAVQLLFAWQLAKKAGLR
jgi:hypothetical protein